MTSAEKFKEVFGFEVDKSKCPFKRCSEGCGKEPSWNCTEFFWQSEYKEPKQNIFNYLTATGQGMIEGEKIADAEWIKAIKKIKAEIEAKNTSIEDFADTHGWVNGLTNEHNAHEADLAIITKHTKELL